MTTRHIAIEGSDPVLNRVLDRVGPQSMSETNEHAITWPAARLHAVDDIIWSVNPSAVVPIPLSCWRTAADLGRYFRSRTPVLPTILSIDLARKEDRAAYFVHPTAGVTSIDRLRRATINVPPQHGMSGMGLGPLPAWCWP